MILCACFIFPKNISDVGCSFRFKTRGSDAGGWRGGESETGIKRSGEENETGDQKGGMKTKRAERNGDEHETGIPGDGAGAKAKWG